MSPVKAHPLSLPSFLLCLLFLSIQEDQCPHLGVTHAQPHPSLRAVQLALLSPLICPLWVPLYPKVTEPQNVDKTSLICLTATHQPG